MNDNPHFWFPVCGAVLVVALLGILLILGEWQE